MMETTILRRLPPVSARSPLLLAGVGLLWIGVSLIGSVYLLIPAGLAFLLGLVVGFSAWNRVRLGHAHPSEGKITLLAATFLNGSPAVYVSFAGYILRRFGV